MTFDLTPYLDQAGSQLETAAKEVFALNRKLVESRNQRRVVQMKPVTAADGRRPYEVSELGLTGSTDGLLASPTGEVTVLDIDAVRGQFGSAGEWFPFEVTVDGILAVVDDDGTVFISTENFPEETLERARRVLHKVAAVLYRPAGR